MKIMPRDAKLDFACGGGRLNAPATAVAAAFFVWAKWRGNRKRSLKSNMH